MNTETLEINTFLFSVIQNKIIVESYVDYSYLYKDDVVKLINFLQQNLEKLSDDRD